MKLATAVALAAISVTAATSSAGSRKATPICGTKAGTPVRISHVIWIWFENHSAGEIVGSSQAPRMTAVARSCGFAANYFAVAHPSLPNYIAAISGGTQGISDDNSPASHPLSVVSLFEQARSARSYEESMPSSCDTSSPYPYAVKHNPEAYYLRVRKACQANDIALGTIAKGAFAHALDAGNLPAFSFVTPNLCNDMHDCSVTTGDAWFGRWLTRITASATYRAGHTAVFVVWDEDDDTAGNRVPLIVISPWTKAGTRSEAHFTHYSLLRTTEQLLGIRARLGHAATAPSLGPAFGL